MVPVSGAGYPELGFGPDSVLPQVRELRAGRYCQSVFKCRRNTCPHLRGVDGLSHHRSTGGRSIGSSTTLISLGLTGSVVGLGSSGVKISCSKSGVWFSTSL